MIDSPALRCRSCGAALTTTFCDLGKSPLSNAYLDAGALDLPEMFYPLHARVCDDCLLVQLPEVETPDNIFTEYAYFSSYSDSWLAHCKAFAAAAVADLQLDAGSKVVELASNDGYLLQYFVEAGVPVLGVDPAANVAQVAIDRGIPTDVSFFGPETAERLKAAGHAADLICANNVMAHVPDLNGFVQGIAHLLKPEGLMSVEFPHLLNLIQLNQFDTIYHEHYSYLSLHAVKNVLARHGLRVVRVDRLPTHGGSLRVWGARNDAGHQADASVAQVVELEQAAQMHELVGYQGFEPAVGKVRRDLLAYLIEAAEAGRTVWAYGAPAKGNTLLNFAGVRPDLLAATVDRNPAKQGQFLPGTHIPIHAPEALLQAQPDDILILPWNLRDEIIAQIQPDNSWGARYVVPIPALEIIEP